MKYLASGFALTIFLSACGGSGLEAQLASGPDGSGSGSPPASGGPGGVSGGGGGGGGGALEPGGESDNSLQSGTPFTPPSESPNEPAPTTPLTPVGEALRALPVLGELIPEPPLGGPGGGNQPRNEGSIAGQPAGTANYAAGSPRAVAFSKIAARRQQCGFAPFHQNSQLDTAAQGHADYLKANMRQSGHIQEEGKPGFTGVEVSERIRATGYTPANGKFGFETVGLALEDFQTVNGHFEGLLGVPYHSFAFFVPNSEIGIGESVYTDNRGKFVSNAVFNFATHEAGPDQVPVSAVAAPLTFPCAGVDGVYFENTGSENPRPVVNGRARALSGRNDAIGAPITVIGEFSDRVQLSFARMTPVIGAAQTGNFVGGTLDVSRERTSMRTDDATNLTLMQASTDPNISAQNLQFFGIVQPAARLEPSTVYEVFIEGTLTRGGQSRPFVRQFRFKTSAPDPQVCPPSSTRCTGYN